MGNEITLPAKVQEQIEKDAVKYARELADDRKKHGMKIDVFDVIKSRIVGATEYATRLHQAIKLLKKFISRHEAGLLPDIHIYNEIKSFLNGI